MRVQIDCYPCILSQLSELAKKAVGGEDEQHAFVKHLMKLVLDADDRTTPPEFAGKFHDAVVKSAGEIDPYREVKDRSTELGLKLLPDLRRMAETAADPFEAAVRLAIGGNIIDYGVNPNFDLRDAEARIREVLDLPFDSATCAEFKRRLDSAKSIFYMLDNCGEAVIDRLLIEPYADKITLGVRGFPTLNDVTRREVEPSGITGVRRIVDTGDRAPGVSLRFSNPELLDAMRSSDVVVCKGQGNFESLDEACTRPTFFLLRVKCRVVADRVKSPLGSIRIIGKNL